VRYRSEWTATRRLRSRARSACSATGPGWSKNQAGVVAATSERPAASMKSVRTNPGQTAVTATPCGRTSVCSASVNESTAAFAAAYVAIAGHGAKLLSEPMFRTAPRPPAIIGGT
jgi:hypothetical protein